MHEDTFQSHKFMLKLTKKKNTNIKCMNFKVDFFKRDNLGMMLQYKCNWKLAFVII